VVSQVRCLLVAPEDHSDWSSADFLEALVLYQKRPPRRKLVSLIRICGGRF
jgi:hypothetical protein